MGTRGLYGLRKNGMDKTSYNHFDSYPEGLGADIVQFILHHSIQQLNDFYDRIIMVDEDASPTAEEIERCKANNSINLSVSTKSTDDWYCLLRKFQGELESLYWEDYAYMIDGHDFIKNSLFCEYAYIINLDTNMLEFYEGFCEHPQKGNRYGTECDNDGYYPCRLVKEIPIDSIHEIDNIDAIITQMMG